MINQQQQMYQELRKLRQVNDKLRDQNEDMKEELKEISQKYLMVKKEAQYYKSKYEDF